MVTPRVDDSPSVGEIMKPVLVQTAIPESPVEWSLKTKSRNYIRLVGQQVNRFQLHPGPIRVQERLA